MTLPTGTISLSQVNTELDISPSSTTINMGATAVRTLADAPSGAIAMSDLQGKSNAQFIQATGGTIATQGDFKVHTFNSNATFTVQGVGNEAGSNTVEYLVVAGGGSGGAGYGGGGGAGGFRVNYPSPAAGGLPVSAQGYPITIGGGASGAPNARYTTKGQDGSNSTFSSITSEGGGGGGALEPQYGGAQGLSGGSGGGAGAANSSPSTADGAGNSPPVSPPQGNPGGHAFGVTSPYRGGGGGGGASETGGNAPQSPAAGGAGGDGTANSITGSPVTYAGGGGGGVYPTSGSPNAPGGDGGGGNGGGPSTGQAGGTNLGGGSGAAGGLRNGSNSGGSGKVVIRYKFQ